MSQDADNVLLSDNHVDDHVDTEIQQCFSSNPPNSFFMFAGAGSGKTRSLIKALEYLDQTKGTYLAEHGKQVAVITYTNAACDEIGRRLQYKPIFQVSTIHSFLWELIKHFQTDIRAWVIASIEAELTELLFKQSKGKGGAAALKRAEKIAAKKDRLKKINKVKRFSYNPNGDNLGYDSLSHDEVVKIGSEFIAKEETMQRILVSKYPILLIDESQDTKKELVDALLGVYAVHKQNWSIGMFGDTMQKIYTDGKDRLEEVVPKEWTFPVKVMNHRSAKRIVSLANAIRSSVDDKKQRPRTDASEGTVRLFIADVQSDKEVIERKAAIQMAEHTKDANWKMDDGYESLILEHHMAASRFSFSNLYTPLNEAGVFSNALRKGEISEIAFLAKVVAPLIMAYKTDDMFELTKQIRQNSPLLSKKMFDSHPELQQKMLEKAEAATEKLLALWKDDTCPSCIEILRNIRSTGLFDTTERIGDIVDSSYSGEDTKVLALKTALSVSFDEMERYAAYVSDQTRFTTHQGVKGLEYPRVMVVLDDSDAKGFLFSYEKLFGAKEQTATDLKNEKEGKDTSIRRTARLFYVACTRAKESLAVVAYSENPEAVKSTAVSNGWFNKSEIIMLDDSDNQ